MKIFTVAKKVHQCYGHGDYGDELHIVRGGYFGDVPFPCCFKTREQAEKWFLSKGNSDSVIVELELVD